MILSSQTKVEGKLLVGIVRFCLSEQEQLFFTQNLHHSGAKCWCILVAEMHDFIRFIFAAGSKESKLFMVTKSNANLMIPATSVQKNDHELATRVAEVFDAVGTPKNWIFENPCDNIEGTRTDA